MLEERTVRQKGISVVFFLFFLSFLPTVLAASVPDWVRALAQQPAKHYPDDVDAVRLLDEGQTTVKDNGEFVTQARIVYRILRPEGKGVARLALGFDNETKINYLHGWSITAKGQEYEAKEKDALEMSVSSYGEIYSDDKEKVLLLPGADVGTVVAFEFEHKSRPYLFQDEWIIQTEIPVEKSRYTLQLPPSWEYRADWVNHPEVPPVISGNTYTWELNDIPRIEKEYHRPPTLALASRIIITFFSERIKNQTYKTWKEFGAWYAQLAAGMRDPNPALEQKARELAPASLPLLDRIRNLARFSQHDIRYAAIKIGIGGFRPHSATETFSHKYGDCKDKATLLSSMLSQIGIKSYYLLVNTDRGMVVANTPPQAFFDHMILAIQLPDASFSKPLPALYEHSKLGHLLIFDPTNEWVPFGQLPYYEQDNYALLVADDGGELIHLPVGSPELNELKLNAKLKLLPDGSLQGQIEEVLSGYQAMMERAYLQEETQRDRKRMIEHFLGSSVGNFQLDGLEIVNEAEIDKDLILKYKFTADHYAKSAGPLLLVRPRVVGESAGYFDATKPRHYPYEFHAPFVQSDTIEITLPEGFKVDELPDPADAHLPFAQYVSKTETNGNILKYTREYKMTTTLVPVDSIKQLQTLFSQIISDEKSMAVLKRAN
jgi:Domain of Unknown Function with PDB structure (DUF3857)